MARRRLSVLLLLTALAMASLVTAPLAMAPDATTGADPVRLVVRAGTADRAGSAAAAAAIRAAGGRVVAVQPTLGTAVGAVRSDDAAASAARIAAADGIVAVSPDQRLAPASLGTDSAGRPGSMRLVAQTVQATTLWKQGITGDGVGVALLDTGVAPVPGLLGSDKVVLGPDLSFESVDPARRHLDGYGHGTHLAGIIAGREGAYGSGFEYATDSTRFFGIAPDASVLSIRLGDSTGAVDVSQVIAGIDFVVQRGADLDPPIRVLTLAYGTPPRQPARDDPLAFAAEVATRRGILVVAAAGNNGSDGSGLANPAYNPHVLAVGATDTRGTTTPADDTLAPFSARGTPTGRVPDVVAPGTSLVSLRVPGSQVAVGHPAAAVGMLGIRGSGTSQAAAVVSGAAALLLQARPWLTPAQIQDVLRRTARPLAGAGPAAGGGTVQALSAVATNPQQAVQPPPGLGTGSLELARGGVHVAGPEGELTGEQDIFGSRWDARTVELTANGQMWSADGTFNGVAWTGSGPTADGGPAGSWTGWSWATRPWPARSWTSNAPAPGATSPSWPGRTWTDVGWDDDSAGSKVWATVSWPAR